MPTRTRRALLLTLPLPLTTPTLAQSIPTGPLEIALQPIAFVQGGATTDFAHPPGQPASHLYVTQKDTGEIRRLDALDTTFLDIDAPASAGGAGIPLFTDAESGLLAFAFHPNFSAPADTPGRGLFYTFTSEPKGPSLANVDFFHPSQVPSNGGTHDNVIREWSVNPSTGLVDLAAGSRPLLRIRNNAPVHNGGALKFDPGGYLHIATGDGTFPEDGPQLLSSAYGKLLRIDPLAPASTPNSPDPASPTGRYRIPAANPFRSVSGALPEVYAYGFRNPFRFSFDRATGDLFLGDVGELAQEEINRVTAGGNYGWPHKEGTADRSPAPPGFASVPPLAAYTHADGIAVAGGFVYRGADIPELYGTYVFADVLLPSLNRARLFYMNPAGGPVREFTYLPGGAPPASALWTFGEGPDGELYSLFPSGPVSRILGPQWSATTPSAPWSSPANWIGAVPNAPGAPARFLRAPSLPANGTSLTITLDTPHTGGSLLFNNPTTSFTLAGPAPLTLASADSTPPSITVLSGSHKIAAPLNLTTPITLSLSPGAALDLTTNALTLTGIALPALRSYLASRQLTSSAPDPNDTLSLAYLDTGTSILLKLTLAGDANLDGLLTPDDYALLDRGFATSGQYWWQGDFNYDGAVTPADYLLIDRAFLLTSASPAHPTLFAHREAQFGPAYVSALLAAIPEPSSLACFAAGFWLFARPTRRGVNG